MADTLVVQHDASREPEAQSGTAGSSEASAVSFLHLWRVIVNWRKLAAGVLLALLSVCLLYCLIAPKEYEAKAKVAVRVAAASPLNPDSGEGYAGASTSFISLQQETLANIFRSDRLAWRVIRNLKLYAAPAFAGRFARRYPDFHPEMPDPAAQAYLLERFAWRLNVQALPHTFLIQIRFRCQDPVLSAAVVNELIRVFGQEEGESRVKTIGQASDALGGQLTELRSRMDADRLRLANYQRAHGVISTPEMLANGQPSQVQHIAALQAIDELGRQQVAATTDRILREAEYRAASRGDPEVAIVSDPRLQSDSGGFATALLEKLRAQRSDLELEQAQLKAEHGPNFPRVVEIRGQAEDLDRQIQAEDAKLLERFRSAWQTALDREQMVRKNLAERTEEGMKLNQAATEYALLREEAESSQELYLRVKQKVAEAGLLAGAQGLSIAVVDDARPPARPVAPDLPLYMGISAFVGIWLALGTALAAESLAKQALRKGVLVLLALAPAISGWTQAPTPSTSGLPTGVARIAPAQETKTLPDPKEAPAIWNTTGVIGAALAERSASLSPMPAPIGPGDLLDVAEFHAPEFHTMARVAPAGTISLPMVREVAVGGFDEQAAARAIEAALAAQGILLHPQVSVRVAAYAGQDVSVLGEVARPGVYPYTVHHRLLDMISAASGLAPTAGRLVNIFHRNDPKTPHPYVLDPGATDTGADHNPELAPGDTVQVSRAGLVYVIGDVVRPGGFAVDPAQGLTVVQALSLAWGPSLNAATQKALLIREQKGGRTLTRLNLKRLLRGLEPDQPVYDRDILFVPDSTAKNLWNRTMESAIQSVVGVSIYSALVYSQRY